MEGGRVTILGASVITAATMMLSACSSAGELEDSHQSDAAESTRYGKTSEALGGDIAPVKSSEALVRESTPVKAEPHCPRGWLEAIGL